ncbi:hypothetical protein BU17DRAFT_84640 [Hysterangium stoloniferum]|nr:hypothetical protein BU17DRAFT_84640 [Hysterangium stoloniferum]
MAFTGNSPRKVVPLSGASDTRPQTPVGSSTTLRAFFCGVVVESGRDLNSDVRDLVASLGEHMPSEEGANATDTLHPELSVNSQIPRSLPTQKYTVTNSSALADNLNEFVSTERSYVKRLRILKEAYADPLRTFAKAKDTALLPPYEAKILFGNIDNILPVNEAFLFDLEKMLSPNGYQSVGGIGDVALKHFKELGAFGCYKQYYSNREEAQLILKRERMKKSSTGFAAFVERIKDSTSDIRNRVGLSELLMDPVQRIPRYTLLWDEMIKNMALNDPQRAKLVEARQIAQKVAKCDADDHTRRAAVMYCLERTVDDFPPALISIRRRLIDCIDVEDVPVDNMPLASSMSVSTTASASSVMPCTLFLFDDKLMIVKRPNASASGKILTSLDQVDKAAKNGALPSGLKKNGMSFKGVIDITDIVATDVGIFDFHMYFEKPPQDQTERWSGRPFRSFSVVPTGSSDAVDTQSDKHRFLKNLWTTQALFRSKEGRSVILCSTEKEVEARGGRITLAKTYFNVYRRTAYLSEPVKPKVVLHVDAGGAADALPFGLGGPPYVIVRVQPMAGELCRYAVTSCDPDDDGEEDIVHTATVPSRIVQTIHQFGLFKFRTGHNSTPSTPTASLRSRAAIFGLDAISRNLFPGVIGKGGDVFGAVLNNNHKRSRSATSRASTQTTTTLDSAVRFSTRSTSTAATSLMLDEETYGESPTRKLQRGRKSPSNMASPDKDRSRSQSRSNSVSRPATSGDEGLEPANKCPTDESDWDLSARLELARKNSRNQHGRELPVLPTNPPVEDTIYEEEPPAGPAMISRASRPTTPVPPRSTTPRMDPAELPHVSRSRPTSAHGDRRPVGPRAPSPLPPRSPDYGSESLERALESTLDQFNQGPPSTPVRTPSKASSSLTYTQPRRLPLEPKANDAAPRGTTDLAQAGSVEPLTIKKKVSLRSNPGKGSSPISRHRSTQIPTRTTSTRTSPQVRGVKRTMSLNDHNKPDLSDRLLITAQSTREDVDSVRRVVKRIKLEVNTWKSTLTSDSDTQDSEVEFATAKTNVLPRSPHTRQLSPAKSEAEARKEELRQLIAMRRADSPFRRLPAVNSPKKPSHSHMKHAPPRLQEWTETVDTLVGQSERELKRAAANQELLLNDLKFLVAEHKEKASEIMAIKAELQNSKRQCELVRKLFDDAAVENDILHKAFNEELDGMFNDANMPESDAWSAMTKDLRETKAARNDLKRENATLKRKLAEVELQKEQWGALLRAHGLIP